MVYDIMKVNKRKGQCTSKPPWTLAQILNVEMVIGRYLPRFQDLDTSRKSVNPLNSGHGPKSSQNFEIKLWKIIRILIIFICFFVFFWLTFWHIVVVVFCPTRTSVYAPSHHVTGSGQIIWHVRRVAQQPSRPQTNGGSDQVKTRPAAAVRSRCSRSQLLSVSTDTFTAVSALNGRLTRVASRANVSHSLARLYWKIPQFTRDMFVDVVNCFCQNIRRQTDSTYWDRHIFKKVY